MIPGVIERTVCGAGCKYDFSFFVEGATVLGRVIATGKAIRGGSEVRSSTNLAAGGQLVQAWLWLPCFRDGDNMHGIRLARGLARRP
jgi:hypothetical protein